MLALVPSLPRIWFTSWSLIRDIVVFTLSVVVCSRKHICSDTVDLESKGHMGMASTSFTTDSKLLESLKQGTSRDATERVCTVDDHNRPTLYGHDRRDVRLYNLWHRATYVIVRHEQQRASLPCSPAAGDTFVLVQRRSLHKDYCPGKLDPTPGGVVDFAESYDDNAIRELEEEMGIRATLLRGEEDDTLFDKDSHFMQALFDFPYEDERVRCWGRMYEVFYHGSLSDVKIQKEEVDEVLRLPLTEVKQWIENSPNDWTPDSAYALQLYLQHTHDRRLMRVSSSLSLERYRLRPQPRVIFFDCDDCLYFDGWTVARQITKKIDEWCVEKGLPSGEAYELYKRHGTALKGLLVEGFMEHCEEAVDDFLHAVHDVKYHSLSRDEELRKMLIRLKDIPKYIFTASARHHAERCLDVLGIRDLFEDIIDTKSVGLHTKYSREAFEIAMRIAGVPMEEAERCLFLDDSVKNIKAAQQIGWRCVLVGRVGRDCGTTINAEGHAEHEIDKIHDFPKVFPELFQDS
jgi:pyrimidine 5'-nucleotidase